MDLTPERSITTDERQLQDNDYEKALDQVKDLIEMLETIRTPEYKEGIAAIKFLLNLDVPNPYKSPYTSL